MLSGNLNIRQATSWELLKVTILCVYTLFHLSPLISRIIHRDVLAFAFVSTNRCRTSSASWIDTDALLPQIEWI